MLAYVIEIIVVGGIGGIVIRSTAAVGGAARVQFLVAMIKAPVFAVVIVFGIEFLAVQAFLNQRAGGCVDVEGCGGVGEEDDVVGY